MHAFFSQFLQIDHVYVLQMPMSSFHDNAQGFGELKTDGGAQRTRLATQVFLDAMHRAVKATWTTLDKKDKRPRSAVEGMDHPFEKGCIRFFVESVCRDSQAESMVDRARWLADQTRDRMPERGDPFMDRKLERVVAWRIWVLVRDSRIRLSPGVQARLEENEKRLSSPPRDNYELQWFSGRGVDVGALQGLDSVFSVAQVA